jgi:hypothetical protein
MSRTGGIPVGASRQGPSAIQRTEKDNVSLGVCRDVVSRPKDSGAFAEGFTPGIEGRHGTAKHGGWSGGVVVYVVVACVGNVRYPKKSKIRLLTLASPSPGRQANACSDLKSLDDARK